jgi:phage shock protein B
MEEIRIILICAFLFMGMPWLFLHYWSKFRAAKGISTQDEQLMDDLYSTARRLDARLESIERIIAAENPQWKEHSLSHQRDAQLADKHQR